MSRPVHSLSFLYVLLSVLAGSPGRAQRVRPRSTLETIRRTHVLACGVVHEDAEYSTEDDHSSRGTFDEALCQAFAVAADAQVRVKLTSFLDETSAVRALRKGQMDAIATLSADEGHRIRGVRLSRPVFYDALALLTPVAGGAQRPEDLAGKTICVLAETGTEEALRAWYARHGIDYLPFPFQEEGEMEAAYASNNCAALAGERTRLASIRASLGEGAREHRLLAEPLSEDPMGSATRGNDAVWSQVVDATAGALLLAEQLGITAEGSRPRGAERNPEEQLFRSETEKRGAALGLRPSWAEDVVESLGNFGQVYERTLGSGSDRQLPRDLNRLRRNGGLLRLLGTRTRN